MEETTTQTAQAESDQEAIDALMQSCRSVREQLAKVIVGQEEVVEQLLIVLLPRGHVASCREAPSRIHPSNWEKTIPSS
jgi:hypothetical protein